MKTLFLSSLLLFSIGTGAQQFNHPFPVPREITCTPGNSPGRYNLNFKAKLFDFHHVGPVTQAGKIELKMEASSETQRGEFTARLDMWYSRRGNVDTVHFVIEVKDYAISLMIPDLNQKPQMLIGGFTKYDGFDYDNELQVRCQFQY